MSKFSFLPITCLRSPGSSTPPYTDFIASGNFAGWAVANEIVVLGTAHPAKFSDVVLKQTNIKPELPNNLQKILNQKEKFEELPNDLKKVKDYILDRA